MKINFLYIFLFFISIPSVFASMDVLYSKDYGNVKVHIKTGSRNYEEINKVFIYAQLVEKLCEELNYKEQIFLDFNHTYTSEVIKKTSCFVSFGYGCSMRDEKKEDPLFSKEILTITQIGKFFNAVTTLKLVEFAVKNTLKIKNKQVELTYKTEYKYIEYLLKSYDTIKIKEVVKTLKSSLITKVMSNRINRSTENYNHRIFYTKNRLKEIEENNIFYYFKDNKFTLFYSDDKGEKELTTLRNVYQIEKLDSNSALIFDTDESFIYLRSGYSGKHISKKHIIEKIKDNYNTFEVEKMNHGKIFIRSSFWSKEREGNVERLLAYIIYDDTLIQDLNEVLEKEINLFDKEEKGIWERIKNYFD